MKKLSSEELDRLMRELASFSRSGLPMPAGLKQLASSLRPGRMQDLVSATAADLERGSSLSEALAKRPEAVTPEFIALIRCGEISGDLHGILAFAVEHGRRLQQHRSSLITTLIYPAMVFVALFISAWLVANFIVPHFVDIFNQLGAELPAPTQFFIFMMSWIASPLGTLNILLLAAYVVFLLVRGPVRDRAAAAFGRLPGFRGLAALSDTALMMKFVGRMTARSVPLPDALRAASLAVWLRASRDSLRRMGEAAEQGQPVGPHLSAETPATAAWLFVRAEERGDLPAACEGIADYCEDRFDRLSKRAVAVLEPVLLIVVALAVGLMLVSLYLPLFNIPKLVGGD